MKENTYPAMPTTAEVEAENKHIAHLQLKHDELKKEATVDCQPINQKNLNLNDFNKTALEVKWLNYRSDYVRMAQKHRAFLKAMYRELYEFYTFDYNLKLSKEQIQTFIETDERYSQILDRALVLENIVDYCSDILDKLKNKGFEIKNYIDYNKWIKGYVD